MERFIGFVVRSVRFFKVFMVVQHIWGVLVYETIGLELAQRNEGVSLQKGRVNPRSCACLYFVHSLHASFLWAS